MERSKVDRVSGEVGMWKGTLAHRIEKDRTLGGRLTGEPLTDIRRVYWCPPCLHLTASPNQIQGENELKDGDIAKWVAMLGPISTTQIETDTNGRDPP
jgi:hypothetical protein